MPSKLSFGRDSSLSKREQCMLHRTHHLLSGKCVCLLLTHTYIHTCTHKAEKSQKMTKLLFFPVATMAQISFKMYLNLNYTEYTACNRGELMSTLYQFFLDNSYWYSG
jgi:hypothetical protein